MSALSTPSSPPPFPLHYIITPPPSTQELSKTHALTHEPPFAIYASSQLTGRGTSNRTWYSPPGNLYLTIALPSAPYKQPGFPLTLLPLHVGVVTYHAVKSALKDTPNADLVELKWPNDVLLDGKKVSGTIIEYNGADTFFVGIGINVNVAPVIPSTGGDNGRESTCLAEYGLPVSDAEEAVGLVARAVVDGFYADSTPNPADIVAKFGEGMRFGKEVRIRSKGMEMVVPVALQEDGQLVVEVVGTKEVRVLSAEYLL